MGTLHAPQFALDPEELANWFLRLNGFFTIPNFVVHPAEGGRPQRTDADILAIRYPDRAEVAGGKALADDPRFLTPIPLFVIAEVKTGRCRLNGPWTQAADRNVQLVLRATGVAKESELDAIATALYEQRRFNGGNLEAALVCFGAERNEQLAVDVLQVTWAEVAEFLFRRYRRYRASKRDHQQWPKLGRDLWVLANGSLPGFRAKVCSAIRPLNSPGQGRQL